MEASKTKVTLGRIAFILSLLSVLGATLCSYSQLLFAGMLLAHLALLAIILGAISRFRWYDRAAGFAIVFGTLASFYLPTLWLH